MGRSYEESSATRRAKLDDGSGKDQEVFEQAYSIAMQVVELRERHGLTQSELAQRCGMDQADISRIERGSTSPTARVLQRIADVMNADVRLVERRELIGEASTFVETLCRTPGVGEIDFEPPPRSDRPEVVDLD